MMKNTKMMQIVVAGGLALSCLSRADGAITSLRPDDSLDGFTTSTPQLEDNPVEGVNVPAAGANDDLWGFASSNAVAAYGSNSLDPNDDTSNLSGQIWTSRADLGEEVPQLTTTLGGLDAGESYFIYLYHVVRGDAPWGLSAHIDGVTGAAFFGFSAGDLIEENPSIAPDFKRVLLGTVSGMSSVDIIVDDATNVGDYKGVGVALVPEPASFILLLGSVFAVLLPLARGRIRKQRCEV